MSKGKSVAWPRIASTTLADRVYHALRTRILEGQLTPGEFIRESDLSTAMGVSRSPVREAMGRLASENFLERVPHRGFRVPLEPVSNLLDLYPIVAALDLLAGRLAIPRLSSHDIAQLKQINAGLRDAKDRHDVRLLIELNNEFHHFFGERSGNRRLSDLLDDLRSQLTQLENWYYSDAEQTERSIQEHDGIIEAIEGSRFEDAVALLENNMSLTYRSLLSEVKGG